MSEDDVLYRASALIARALRHQHGGASAIMQFDPCDPEDTRAWLRERIRLRGTTRYSGPPGIVLRNLVFDARQEARKSRRRWFSPNRGRKVSRNRRTVYRSALSRRYSEQSRLDDDLLSTAIALPLPDAGLGETTEALAATAAKAAERLVAFAIYSPDRKAEAMLACLARLTALVGETVGAAGASNFARKLALQDAFLSLPLSPIKRDDFVSRIANLQFDGNLRRDLRLAGLPWPSTAQWDVFVEALRSSEVRLAA